MPRFNFSADMDLEADDMADAFKKMADHFYAIASGDETQGDEHVLSGEFELTPISNDDDGGMLIELDLEEGEEGECDNQTRH